MKIEGSKLFHSSVGKVKRLAFMNDRLFTHIQYIYKFKRIANLKQPKLFNEKLQWLKLNYRDPLITKCANKSLVRDYVSRAAGNNILIPQIAVFSSGAEFSLSEMPKKFVLKAAHASGWNYICKNKHEADETNIRVLIDTWVASDFSTIGREAMYRGSKRVVVCEEFLDGGEGDVPRDYKFFCFHGEPQFVQVDYNRFSGHARTLYDMEWKMLPCVYEYPLGPDESGQPPYLFDKMIEIAKKLSKPFPFVRVDLYEAQRRVWFGELTFCPEKACGRFKPQHYDLELGKLLHLSTDRFIKS